MGPGGCCTQSPTRKDTPTDGLRQSLAKLARCCFLICVLVFISSIGVGTVVDGVATSSFVRCLYLKSSSEGVTFVVS